MRSYVEYCRIDVKVQNYVPLLVSIRLAWLDCSGFYLLFDLSFLPLHARTDSITEEEYFIPSEEANEVECLLVEHQNDHVAVDKILCSPDDKIQQCMEIEDATYRFGMAQLLDITPLQVEGGNCQAENGGSTTCEDYLLDNGLDCDASERLHFGNSDLENQIMGFNCCDNVPIGISDSSTTIISVPHCQNTLIDKAICELNANFSNKHDAETSIESNWLNYRYSESQNIEKLEDVLDLSVTKVSSDENEMIVETESLHKQDLLAKNSAQNCNSSAIFRQKRLRKPTRRYMDESSGLNSRYCQKTQGESTSTSKGRFLGVKCRKNHHVGSRTVPSADESFCNAIQVPFSPRGRKECQKKHVSTVMQTYIESSPPAKSEDKSMAVVRSEVNGGLRKHHKLWTLSEVRNLIDGVSQFGVGKWTQIKKLLFSSSPHRTPVDLKDEQKRSRPWRPLPKSMLRRVNELAAIYPYPRGRNFKLNSHVNTVSSPAYRA
ncbi:hypothetical protein LguiA_032297 [Lonicera macranthoides]